MKDSNCFFNFHFLSYLFNSDASGNPVTQSVVGVTDASGNSVTGNRIFYITSGGLNCIFLCK